MPTARKSGSIRRRTAARGNSRAHAKRDRARSGRSVQRVSNVLGALRLAEVVRYDTDGKRNRYRLKHPSEAKSILAALSRFVKAASAVGH